MRAQVEDLRSGQQPVLLQNGDFWCFLPIMVVPALTSFVDKFQLQIEATIIVMDSFRVVRTEGVLGPPQPRANRLRQKGTNDSSYLQFSQLKFLTFKSCSVYVSTIDLSKPLSSSNNLGRLNRSPVRVRDMKGRD
jgi:hypothetical protein